MIFVGCTYSHFEQTAECPTCSKTLSENDFTELVVAEASSPTSDITKTSLQALFSKHSKTTSSTIKGLQFSDLCYSLIRQIDVTKQSTKFLLKQLLMDNSATGRKYANAVRINCQLKHEITNLRQGHSTQRLQLEQTNNDLKNKLAAKDNTIEELHQKIREKDKMIDQFRQLHNKMTNQNSYSSTRTNNNHSSNDRSHHPHAIPLSGGRNIANNRFDNSEDGQSISKPPLKGFMVKKSAPVEMQKRSYGSMGAPNIPLSLPASQGVRRPLSYGMNDNDSVCQSQRSGVPSSQHPLHLMSRRPYSSNSSGSVTSTTPRIRDLSSSSGYSFTGGSNNQRLNKRRRGDSAPGSNHGPMSPSTAFTLNQGPYGSGPSNRWMQRGSR